MKPFCLSIAGFDPCAGAGVLADAETFTALGVGSAALVTTITAQNGRRVDSVHPLAAKWVLEQAWALFEQGRPAAVKIGLLGSAAAARAVAKILDRLPGVPVVLDPVLRASVGAELLPPAGVKPMRELLLERATVVTPNVQEAGALVGRKVVGSRGMRRAALDLFASGPRAVVVTGGDRRGDPLDVLCDGRGVVEYSDRRIPVGPVHGTGCRFSSALAAGLARGLSIRRAVQGARRYVRLYLRAQLGS
ncbi:MAG TPA: hydroxymethylpyrimidine/phosphomethylpyrimidine kinase [Myxococcota bacterium]|nr:hydroxymethylpyrimidine/phosphomethylpyrimidine kinase [Myxococcota bacterium]